MTTDYLLNHEFNTWKFQAQTWGEHIVYRNCFWHSEQFLYTTCSPHVLQKKSFWQRFTCIGDNFFTELKLLMLLSTSIMLNCLSVNPGPDLLWKICRISGIVFWISMAITEMIWIDNIINLGGLISVNSICSEESYLFDRILQRLENVPRH